MIKFYICNTCGNLMQKVEDGGTTPSCCGHPMVPLMPASTDGAKEKHVPVVHYEVIGQNIVEVSVQVGDILHPSDMHHYIAWIAIETESGSQLHKLNPGDTPETKFFIQSDDQVLNAYAYCNLHGLWEA